MNKILEAAKKAGADIGTWDKSGNGQNLVSFSYENLTKFAELLQSQSEPVALIALKSAEFQKRIGVLEDLLASAYNIANRNGESTHWQRFAGQLHVNGISPVTPKTFKILPSDTEYAQSAQPTPSQSVVDERAEFNVEFAKTGYQYGEDALEQVFLGWKLASAQLNTKPKNDALDAEKI